MLLNGADNAKATETEWNSTKCVSSTSLWFRSVPACIWFGMKGNYEHLIHCDLCDGARGWLFMFISLRFALLFRMCGCGALHTHTFTLQKEGPTCEWKWIQRCAKNVHKCHKYICSMHTHTCHAPSCTHHYGNATFYLLEIICVVFFLYFNSISFARRLFGAGFGLRLYTHRYTPHNDEDALRSKSSIGRSFTLLSLAPCVRCDVAIIKFQIKPSQEKTHGAHHQCFGIIIETPSSSSSSHTQQRDYGRWFVS